MFLNVLLFIIGLIVGSMISGLLVKLYSDRNLELQIANTEKEVNEELIKVKTQLESFESLRQMIKNDFVVLAQEAIEKKEDGLRKQHQEALDLKLAPLAKELGEFKSKIEDFNVTGVKNTTDLIAKINNLEKTSTDMTKEANLLARALTTNQNVKGAYGESLLDSILQYSGMQEGIHYTKQFVSKSIGEDEITHTIRPDIVVNLPDSRHLVIDSKMTLTSYLEYMQDETQVDRFKAEVKKRIIDLADKNYQKSDNLYQPDFILMYIPIDNSLQVLYEDSELINKAYKANVIIVGTSSLLTTIRLVNQLMSQQKQQDSVNQIVQAGTNLYETFAKFCEDLRDVQKKFEQLNIQFNKTVNRFQRGNKHNPSLFSQVEALRDFGIATTKEIPQELLEEVDELAISE